MDPTKILQKYPGQFCPYIQRTVKVTADPIDGQASVETNVASGAGDVGIAVVIWEVIKQGIRYFFTDEESSRIMSQIPESEVTASQLVQIKCYFLTNNWSNLETFTNSKTVLEWSLFWFNG